MKVQVSWGCEDHAEQLAAGRAVWNLPSQCDAPGCDRSVTHVPVMLFTAKDKRGQIGTYALCRKHADEVEQQRVDSIVPDYPPGD